MQLIRERFSFRFENFFAAYSLRPTGKKKFSKLEEKILEEAHCLSQNSLLTGNIIGAAIDMHRALGPGLLESAYEACFVYELRLRRLKVELQKPLPIYYLI